MPDHSRPLTVIFVPLLSELFKQLRLIFYSCGERLRMPAHVVTDRFQIGFRVTDQDRVHTGVNVEATAFTFRRVADEFSKVF